MKIMIKYRLFLAMLAATCAVVVCMFLIMQWSIGRGFLAYVNTIEKERFEKLAEVLEQSYGVRGGWDFLRDDPAAWSRLVASTLPREGTDQERQDRMERRPPRPDPKFANLSSRKPPPRFGHRFETRVWLLDAARNRIAGPPGQPDRVDFQRLVSERRVVGYLGMRPRQRLTDTHQLLFVKQQKLAMALVAAVMLLISAAISLPLANRLVLPIRRLAASMHRLATGEFGTRVAVGPEDELGQLARDFNTLALSLEKNEQARRRWVADISHELRTPLSILRGEIEAVQDGVRQAGPDSMRSLHVEVMHLSRLVDDLYQISLYDIGALTYRKSVVDLRDMLADALDSFGPELAQKGISLDAELAPGGEFEVFADPGRLHQLFDNLLDNALKYTDPGGELSVRLERRGDRAGIEFADSAPGVTPEELEKLFDRLYRVESSRNRALGGAGLGLTICRNIVEAHEGSIRALPSPKGGVLISIELPLTGSRA
ncbi:MAG: two-component sensor histidine kinase [Geobacteraceae bacterium GWC2_58_44]|nr:MAG: two-component sensor histidine kinase [Geobacteraceae bacterium GWC2_58_44]HBG05551.1 two-component sensor histidine kinase [Geobacter sp.]